MDITLVLSILLPKLKDSRTRYALIGGVAVGMRARPRATVDVDFLVHRDDLADVHDILTRTGYHRITLTRTFSQYEHDAEPFGDLDVQHAMDAGTMRVLRRAESLRQAGLRTSVKVALAGDLILLKALAIANRPGRRAKDYPDMVALASRARGTLDWTSLRAAFGRLKLTALGRRLERDSTA